MGSCCGTEKKLNEAPIVLNVMDGDSSSGFDSGIYPVQSDGTKKEMRPPNAKQNSFSSEVHPGGLEQPASKSKSRQPSGEKSKKVKKPDGGGANTHLPTSATEFSRNVFISTKKTKSTMPKVELGEGRLKDALRQAANKLIVVLFFEQECEDCEAMRMLYEQFVIMYPNVVFLEANADINSESVENLRIKFLPTVIAFRNHIEVGRLVTTDAVEIEKLIRKCLGDIELGEDDLYAELTLTRV